MEKVAYSSQEVCVSSCGKGGGGNYCIFWDCTTLSHYKEQKNKDRQTRKNQVVLGAKSQEVVD